MITNKSTCTGIETKNASFFILYSHSKTEDEEGKTDEMETLTISHDGIITAMTEN
jgi:hypothetical protein